MGVKEAQKEAWKGPGACATGELSPAEPALERLSSLRSSALNVRNGSFRRRDMRSFPMSRQATPLYRNPCQLTH